VTLEYTQEYDTSVPLWQVHYTSVYTLTHANTVARRHVRTHARRHSHLMWVFACMCDLSVLMRAKPNMHV